MSTPRVTWLYSPPTRRDRILRALDFAPDAVIYDLEDAVAPPDKKRARRNLIEELGDYDADERPHIQVRINPHGTRWFDGDLAAIAELPVVDSVRVPKVESTNDLARVADGLPAHVVVHALIESALGVERIGEICQAPRVAGVGLGEADLRAQLGSDDPAVIDYIRMRLVLGSAAAGIEPPMGSAWMNIRDHDGLLRDTTRLARQGFVGRTAIHPAQLPHIQAAFRPDDNQVAAAERIIAAVGDDANSAEASALEDGTFVDRPVILRAQRTLALSKRLAGNS